MVSDDGYTDPRHGVAIDLAGVPSLADTARAERRALFLAAGDDARRRRASLQARLDACVCKTGAMADAIRIAIVRAESDIDMLRRLADDAKE